MNFKEEEGLCLLGGKRLEPQWPFLSGSVDRIQARYFYLTSRWITRVQVDHVLLGHVFDARLLASLHEWVDASAARLGCFGV